MKTDELQTIWKNIDSEINIKTTDELNQLLTAKTRKTMNKFLLIFIIDILVCIGLIAFILMTTFNRQDDVFYQVNNALLGLFTIFSLIVSLLSLNRLQNNKYNLSLKEWLEQRIKLLTKWLLGKYSKLYIVVIPFLLAMIILSIHVYFEYKPFIEVMKSEESIVGLTVGFIIGLFVSFFTINQIRRYQIKNLEFLKELHSSL